MNPTENAFPDWTDEPHRNGFAWLTGNFSRLCRQAYIALFSQFISVLGALSTPGMKPAGFLQGWALRRLGATCPSNQVWIGPRVHFDYPERVVFGHRIVLGADSRLTARSEIVLGDDFLSAPGLYINTGTHDIATLVPRSLPVRLGAGIWCGTRVTICAGVTVGDGAVIGAGSLVVRDLPPHHLALGSPCKPRRELPPAERSAQPWSNFRLPEDLP